MFLTLTNRFYFLAYCRQCLKPQPLEICRLHAPSNSSSKLCSHSALTHFHFVIKRPRSIVGLSGNSLWSSHIWRNICCKIYFSRYDCFANIQVAKPLSPIKAPSSHLTDFYMVSSYLDAFLSLIEDLRRIFTSSVSFRPPSISLDLS